MGNLFCFALVSYSSFSVGIKIFASLWLCCKGDFLANTREIILYSAQFSVKQDNKVAALARNSCCRWDGVELLWFSLGFSSSLMFIQDGGSTKWGSPQSLGSILGRRTDWRSLIPPNSPFVCGGFKISFGRGCAAVSHRAWLDLGFP